MRKNHYRYQAEKGGGYNGRIFYLHAEFFRVKDLVDEAVLHRLLWGQIAHSASILLYHGQVFATGLLSSNGKHCK